MHQSSNKTVIPRRSKRLRTHLATAAIATAAPRNGSKATRFPVRKLHRLCHLCRAISAVIAPVLELEPISDDTAIRRVVRIKHHVGLLRLKKSAYQGCHLCLLLLRETTEEQIDANSRNLVYTLKYCMQTSSDVDSERDLFTCRYLTMDVPTDSDDRYYAEYTSMLNTDPGTSVDGMRRSSLQYATTASDACFDLAAEWLSSCMNKHELCGRSNEADFLPTRLLFVENKLGSIRIRLCITNELSFPVKYTALSHCWGMSNHIQLSRDNIVAFAESIPVEYLSKTFLDAIIVTLRLGFNYSWIDSLCIKQDDRADWAKESLCMGEIYRNCVLNIAAMFAEDGDGGCFAERQPESLQACRLFNFSARPLYLHPEIRPVDTLQPWLLSPPPPLLTRAWVVQERALAPRSLLYMAGQLEWECLECTASEVYPRLRPYTPSSPWETDVKRSLVELIHNPNNVDSNKWLRIWWNIVSKYTNCNLTVPEDRRMAISGLVNIIQQKTGKGNVRGLWRFDLMQELCWQAYKPSKSLKAPSWSWLSVDGSVTHANHRSEEWVKYSASIRSAPDANSGADSESPSEIVLEGPLVRFSTGPRAHSLYPEIGYDMDLSGWPEWYQSHPALMNKWNPDREFDRDTQLWALQIIFGIRNDPERVNGEERRSWWYFGLVITPLSDGIWNRLGFFTIGVRELEGVDVYETISLQDQHLIRIQ